MQGSSENEYSMLMLLLMGGKIQCFTVTSSIVVIVYDELKLLMF
jgi:hypothetical protein